MEWCESCNRWYSLEDTQICEACIIKKLKEKLQRNLDDRQREIDDLLSRLIFLEIPFPTLDAAAAPNCDLVLLQAIPSTGAGGDGDPGHAPDAVPAHRVVLTSRSPVFKAMLNNNMEESRSGIIKIHDMPYDVLCAFVRYMYTAKAPLMDEQMAADLLVLAEKYEVEHLKLYCEKFMTSKVNNDNAITYYAFAHRHRAKHLLESSLSVLIDNMSTLVYREEYKELKKEDPGLVAEILEAYVIVNTAAGNNTDCFLTESAGETTQIVSAESVN